MMMTIMTMMIPSLNTLDIMNYPLYIHCSRSLLLNLFLSNDNDDDDDNNNNSNNNNSDNTATAPSILSPSTDIIIIY